MLSRVFSIKSVEITSLFPQGIAAIKTTAFFAYFSQNSSQKTAPTTRPHNYFLCSLMSTSARAWAADVPSAPSTFRDWQSNGRNPPP